MKAIRFPHEIRRGSVAVRVYKFSRPATGTRVARDVFTVSWHVAGIRKTKQFADLSGALEEARLKADQLAAGKIEVAGSMTADDAATLAELRKLAGVVPPAAALREWLEARRLCDGQLIPAAKAWGEAHIGGLKSIAVDDAVRAFLAHKKEKGRDTRASYEYVLNRVRDGFAGRPVNSLTSRALDQWIHETFRTQPGKPANPITFNTVRKRLVALWRWCRKEKYLPQAIRTEAEQIEAAQAHDAEIGILTVPDYAVILGHIRNTYPEHLAVAVLAGFCGLRRSELHAQRWGDVNLQRGFLKVTKAKRNTPSKRLVPIPAAAVEWLMACDRSKTYRPPKDRDASKAENRARPAIDLVSPPFGIDRVRTYAREAGIETPSNAFRHSFISYRVAQTGNVAETALEAGNSPAIVHKHYRELVAKEDGERWFGITPGIAAKLAGEHAKKLVKMS
jgi:integrase